VRAGDAVLLAADHAAFDLEDDAERCELVEELGGHAQVVRERQGRSVEHVRLEQRLLTPRPPAARLVDQRAHEGVELLRRSMIGVQRDEDGVALTEHVCIFR